MRLGEGAGRHPGGEGRGAFLGDLLRRDENLAVLLEFGERRVPDEATVEIAAVVACDNVGLRMVKTWTSFSVSPRLLISASSW